MRKIIFGVIVLFLFLVACSQSTTPPSTQNTPANTGAPATGAQQAATAEPTARSADPAVEKLFARIGMVKGYSFDLAKLPDGRAAATYYVKGTKVKIVPILGLEELNRKNVDVIFLDLETKTATGYCAKNTACDPNKEVPLTFSDWDIVLPMTWINQIKYGTAAGTLTYYDRQVTRVRYEAGGKYYEAYLDNYYGMPQRIAVATDRDIKNIESGYEYRNMAFNKVTDEEVVHQFVKPTY